MLLYCTNSIFYTLTITENFLNFYIVKNHHLIWFITCAQKCHHKDKDKDIAIFVGTFRPDNIGFTRPHTHTHTSDCQPNLCCSDILMNKLWGEETELTVTPLTWEKEIKYKWHCDFCCDERLDCTEIFPMSFKSQNIY